MMDRRSGYRADMTRYKVVPLPGRRKHVILDVQIGGYCTLPDDGDPSSLLPLVWSSEPAEQAWLKKCQKIWAAWERDCRPVPRGWRPLPPERSPFIGRTYPDHYYR
jgi:hypothetical protein